MQSGQSSISQAQFLPICTGNVYNCDDLTCDQIAIYKATCAGDPSKVDGNGDGQLCEKRCGS